VEETDVHLSSHLQLLGDRIIHTRDLNTAICISQRPALAPLHPGLPISALALQTTGERLPCGPHGRKAQQFRACGVHLFRHAFRVTLAETIN